jgi:hypothetical protein
VRSTKDQLFDYDDGDNNSRIIEDFDELISKEIHIESPLLIKTKE